jgi:16S rRNA (cytosine967-C5)-methyltransferase
MARPGWEAARDSLLQGAARPVGAAGIVFPPGKAPDDLPRLARDGVLSRQGAGSQRMLHDLRAADWEGPVWDACAGRGGKTCALLEMGKNVRLASDPHAMRLDGLRRELNRLGLPHPELRQGQAQSLNPGFAPRTILLDAPCSGLGALARRPDTRLFRTPDQARELAAAQQAIINAAWERLAPGGRLAYLTCTVNPAENEHQTARLLARPDARLEIEIPARPEADGMDSMYGALVRKMD